MLFESIVTRCNSKASYLPRQSREKLNSDPDHGSYKLTLTSNEDCINENSVFLEDNLSPKCNNLPDVLPVGAKIHSSSPRYGSNNNIHPSYIKSAPSAPVQQTYPMKSMFNFSQNRNSTPSPTSPPYGRNLSESLSPKYMSQSNVDLKKTHILANADTNKIAFLENDGVDLTANTQATNRQSPYALRNEFVNRKISFEDRTNTPNQFVPMAINRSISLTPTMKDEKLIRKDSLKENIDKITQLQSKLMSAHLSESEKNIANLCRDLNVKNNVNDKESSDLIIPVHQAAESKEIETMDETTVRIDSPVVVAEISETTIAPVDGEGEGGVHMIQRTEIVLRLNPPTSEAASQTDGYESMSSDCEDLR
ncbi:hypothetical protein HA402_008626 [Bradysia odoriphaga]|nr:hypothetical protein HA402_008626 [Bradysia odoriphaga]